MSISLRFECACRSAVCWVVALLVSHSVAAQDLVRIGGSRSATGGMQLLARAFVATHPAIGVDVEKSMGSEGGIRALLAGRVDLAVSNRPPTDRESAQSTMLSVEYARTPFVVAVHRNVGATALTSSQLAGLLAQLAARWPDGQRARPVLRVPEAADTIRLKTISADVSLAVDAALHRRGMLYARTDGEAAYLIEHTPGAFGGSTLALIESEHLPLTALQIDGRLPTVAHLVDGSYPWYKSLYLLTRADAGVNTRLFIAFVQSAQGRALLQANGHAPR
jgi:phosphate transport system substrate-binding protein